MNYSTFFKLTDCKKIAANLVIPAAIFIAGCSTNANDQIGNRQPNVDSLDNSGITESPSAPQLNAESNSKDSIIVELIPEQEWRKELEQAMLAKTSDIYDGKIYSRLRQIPDSERDRYDLFRGKLTVHKISTPDWVGEIREAFDSDKLSYRLVYDTIYYELAKKLVVDVTNIKTGQNVKAEITRENVIKNNDEKYAQFNLCGWSIKTMDAKTLQIEQSITLLDSDVGDNVEITIYPKGNISLMNYSTLDNMGDD